MYLCSYYVANHALEIMYLIMKYCVINNNIKMLSRRRPSDFQLKISRTDQSTLPHHTFNKSFNKSVINNLPEFIIS